MPLVVGTAPLTLEDVERVARFGEKVELAPEALDRIRACRSMLEGKIEAGEIVYGVNTGIGEFSEMVLTKEQIRDFQKYLIFNHSAGIGDPVQEENVRAGTRGAGPRSPRRWWTCSMPASPRWYARRGAWALAGTWPL